LASRLFDCATVNGARSLGVNAGVVSPGSLADFFTVDLDDLSIAGHSGEDLLPLAVFSLNRTAIRDVVVNGRFVVRDGRHPLQEEIVSRYKDLHGKLWSNRER
jgi:formimidoylglutamate deiminase